MKLLTVLCATFLGVPLPLYAQHAIKGDRLYTHLGDFAPRFADLGGTVLKIPAGKVVTLPADGTFDAIEVEGELRNDPARDTVLRVANLQILAGGHLNLQVPCGRTLEIVIRDTAIDTAVDPFQWGTGILSFGRQTIIGCPVSQSFTEAAGDLKAGDTTITLESIPSGWRVGHELIIPDTAQQEPFENGVTKNVARRESRVTIAGISGSTLTLSKPLDFDHLTINDYSTPPKPLLRPRVANISRNIVIRSENPQGTPGQTVSVGHTATWDIRYTEFRHLGRTKNILIDSTTITPPHIGTNQIGRYAVHFHHGQGFQSKFIGNALIGYPGIGKWGMALHRVSDSLVEQNVAVDFEGAGFVTEEGPEVRNTIRKNFAAYASSGPAVNQGIVNSPISNDPACLACEGAGFWFGGIAYNIVEGNEAWNNRFGVVFMHRPRFEVYPSVPGGPIDKVLSHPQPWFASYSGNVTAANLTIGTELWFTRGGHAANSDLFKKASVIKHHISANNSLMQVFLGAVPIDTGGAMFQDSVIRCGGGTPGLVFPRPYSFILSVERTDVIGCGIGIEGGGAQTLLLVDGGVWRNRIDFNMPTPSQPLENTQVWITNTTHQPYPFPRGDTLPAAANGLHVITWGDQSPWLPTAATPTMVCAQRVVNWLGTGKTYCLRGGTGAGETPPPPRPPAPPPPQPSRVVTSPHLQ